MEEVFYGTNWRADSRPARPFWMSIRLPTPGGREWGSGSWLL
jgi:hypothetical protein